MTEPSPSATWIDLPPAARDWLHGTQHAVWLPADLSPADRVKARLVLRDWDALVGRLLREAMFSDAGDPRQLRIVAEAVAATAERLAVLLGEVER